MQFVIYGLFLCCLIFSISQFIRALDKNEIHFTLPGISQKVSFVTIIINLIAILYVLTTDTMIAFASSIQINVNSLLSIMFYAVLFVVVLFVINRRAIIVSAVLFEIQSVMPEKIAEIDQMLSKEKITDEEALAQKEKLQQTADFNRALDGAMKGIIKFGMLNFLIIGAAIIAFILNAYLIGREEPAFFAANFWRFILLMFNGFLLTLPSLFIGLSIFLTAKKFLPGD